MISVVVPVYNVGQYLNECVDSILNQRFTDFEVLLVDDGSTDSSGKICDEYAAKDKRVRAFHKKNGGLSSARNYGIEQSKGDYVIFIDSDDLWLSPDCLSELYKYASGKELDVVRFEYQAVDENLTPLEQITFDKTGIQDRILTNYEMVRYAISGEWFAVLYLIRKEILSNIRFDEKVKFQEDIDFYCRLFASRELKCGYLDKRYYAYRKRTASMTTSPKISNLKGSFDLCEVFSNQSELISDDNLKQLYKYNSVMMYYWTLMDLTIKPHYGRHNDIIRQLGLQKLHKKTLERMKNVKIQFKNKIFILPSPVVAVYLRHWTTAVQKAIRKIKSKL